MSNFGFIAQGCDMPVWLRSQKSIRIATSSGPLVVNAASGKMAERPKSAGGKSSECAPVFPQPSLPRALLHDQNSHVGNGEILNS